MERRWRADVSHGSRFAPGPASTLLIRLCPARQLHSKVDVKTVERADRAGHGCHKKSVSQWSAEPYDVKGVVDEMKPVPR